MWPFARNDTTGAATIHAEVSDIDGWLLPGDASGLFQTAQQHGDVILEVGTWRGKSAAVLIQGARSNERRKCYQLFSIDIQAAAGIHASEILGRRGLANNVTFFTGRLSDFRKAFDISPTMAFIDGDHTYQGVRADLAELSSLLCPNVPVVFHDYLNPDVPGVRSAVDEWCGQGFAKKQRSFGCCTEVLTTHKCTGRKPDRGFSLGMIRLLIPLETKERIAKAMPWLVPVVRKYLTQAGKRR